MKFSYLVSMMLLAGCNAEGAPEQSNGRYQIVEARANSGPDFVFDRRTGCIAEIELEAPDILTDEQMERLERGESVGGKRMGFDAWKCPDETKRVNS